MHYQPIVELRTGRVAACEALVRWPDGPRGCSTPSSFIPLAEEIGAVVPIGRSVLQRACRDAQTWDWDDERSGGDPRERLTGRAAANASFVDGIAAALERSGLEPRRLVLEITEGVMLRDPERSIATLHELRALGVQLALDDFGTGYSSLCHLRSLPIDWLKIGMPFMDAWRTADRTGRSSGWSWTSRPTWSWVWWRRASSPPASSRRCAKLGCEFGQGFYLGSPTTVDPVESAIACMATR